jgi:hypothetical protein
MRAREQHKRAAWLLSSAVLKSHDITGLQSATCSYRASPAGCGGAARTSRNVSMRCLHSFRGCTRTRSNWKFSPDHDWLPLSGPNIGCVHRMSIDFGSRSSIRRFGNSLTESTSTKRVERLKRCRGRPSRTARAERMEQQRSTTSGCCSAKSSTSGWNVAPTCFAAAA